MNILLVLFAIEISCAPAQKPSKTVPAQKPASAAACNPDEKYAPKLPPTNVSWKVIKPKASGEIHTDVATKDFCMEGVQTFPFLSYDHRDQFGEFKRRCEYRLCEGGILTIGPAVSILECQRRCPK